MSIERELTRLRGEREILARWMAEACGVLDTLTSEDAEDGGKHLQTLCVRGDRLVRAVLGVPSMPLPLPLHNQAAPDEVTLALRQDAARYRWLAGNSDGNAQNDFIRWLNANVLTRDEVDEAIDAAMAGEPALVLPNARLSG